MGEPGAGERVPVVLSCEPQRAAGSIYHSQRRVVRKVHALVFCVQKCFSQPGKVFTLCVLCVSWSVCLVLARVVNPCQYIRSTSDWSFVGCSSEPRCRCCCENRRGYVLLPPPCFIFLVVSRLDLVVAHGRPRFESCLYKGM